MSPLGQTRRRPQELFGLVAKGNRRAVSPPTSWDFSRDCSIIGLAGGKSDRIHH